MERHLNLAAAITLEMDSMRKESPWLRCYIANQLVALLLEVKKYYYKGIVSGTGSDNEICITDVTPITYREYMQLRKTMISESNAITNYYADQKIRLLNQGYNIGCTEKDIEDYRRKFLK